MDYQRFTWTFCLEHLVLRRHWTAVKTTSVGIHELLRLHTIRGISWVRAIYAGRLNGKKISVHVFSPLCVPDWLGEGRGGGVGKGTRNTVTTGSPYPPDFTPDMGVLYSCKAFQQKYPLECKMACTDPLTMLFNECVLFVSLRGYRFAGMYLARITWPETWGYAENRNLQFAADVVGSSIWMKSESATSQNSCLCAL